VGKKEEIKMTGFFLIIVVFGVAYIIDFIAGGKGKKNNNDRCAKSPMTIAQPCACIKKHDIASFDVRKNPFGW
jgi:hypothetical protein